MQEGGAGKSGKSGPLRSSGKERAEAGIALGEHEHRTGGEGEQGSRKQPRELDRREGRTIRVRAGKSGKSGPLRSSRNGAGGGRGSRSESGQVGTQDRRGGGAGLAETATRTRQERGEDNKSEDRKIRKDRTATLIQKWSGRRQGTALGEHEHRTGGEGEQGSRY